MELDKGVEGQGLMLRACHSLIHYTYKQGSSRCHGGPSS